MLRLYEILEVNERGKVTVKVKVEVKVVECIATVQW